MKKLKQKFLFGQAMERIKEVTGLRTQVELAAYLGIRQSSVADAKRRDSIPSDWLLTLVRKAGTNPDWILYGHGPQHLEPSRESGDPESWARPVAVVQAQSIEEHRAAILAQLPAGFEVVILDPRIGSAIESGQAAVLDMAGVTPPARAQA